MPAQGALRSRELQWLTSAEEVAQGGERGQLLLPSVRGAGSQFASYNAAKLKKKRPAYSEVAPSSTGHRDEDLSCDKDYGKTQG